MSECEEAELSQSPPPSSVDAGTSSPASEPPDSPTPGGRGARARTGELTIVSICKNAPSKGIHIGDPVHHHHRGGGHPAAAHQYHGYPMNGYAAAAAAVHGAGYGHDMNIKMEADMLMDTGSHLSDMSPNGQLHGGAAMLHGDLSPNGQRARKNKEDKICGVCGDRALGYNFDAISCESCKAFFRRNAPKGLDYFKCPYDEKCKMDISNRRFCKRCRLKKCFEIGMRKEYILSEEEKALKRQKIEQNRGQESNKRMAKIDPPPATSTPPGAPPGATAGGSFAPTTTIASQSEMKLSGPVTPMMLRDLERSGSWSRDSGGYMRPITDEDQELITELLEAYDSSLTISVDKEPSRDNAAGMADLVNIAEISVRRVIDMAKKVKSFKSLPQLDQISLLKGGSIELLILRSVITFDKDKQHFLDPLDLEEASAMTIEQFRRAENGLGLFDDHMNFVKSLSIELRADKTTLILLLMISLFSPDRPQLSNKYLVSVEQERYSMILEAYLESKYPYVVAHALYPKLLMKLTDIRNLNEEHSQVLLKVNPEGIQPLMQEVLDLRSRGEGGVGPDPQPPSTSSSQSPPGADTPIPVPTGAAGLPSMSQAPNSTQS